MLGLFLAVEMEIKVQNKYEFDSFLFTQEMYHFL